MSQSHDSLIVEYVEFARFQRIQHIKAVESCFKRFVDNRDQPKGVAIGGGRAVLMLSPTAGEIHTVRLGGAVPFPVLTVVSQKFNLLEGTYTSDEVAEIIQELCQCICGDIESELINTSHMNVLLLKQLFKQAENLGFTLKGNISEMQNGDLLEQIREMELSGVPDYKLVNVEASISKEASEDHHKEDQLINPELAHENLKKILCKKNEVIKDLRERLQNYEDKK